jgi:hypothetical protein
LNRHDDARNALIVAWDSKIETLAYRQRFGNPKWKSRSNRKWRVAGEDVSRPEESTASRRFMSDDKRDVLELLKFELNFLEQGGSGRSGRTPSRSHLDFSGFAFRHQLQQFKRDTSVQRMLAERSGARGCSDGEGSLPSYSSKSARANRAQHGAAKHPGRACGLG